tara:strand:- start:4140 stop:4352 length:213 start_codon:yes stop_codon:yes gene_type:complete
MTLKDSLLILIEEAKVRLDQIEKISTPEELQDYASPWGKHYQDISKAILKTGEFALLIAMDNIQDKKTND